MTVRWLLSVTVYVFDHYHLRTLKRACVLFVACRTKLRAETPGIISLVVYALSTTCSPPANPFEVHAIAPMLVAPNPAVQQEMGSVFSTMQAVLQQQVQMTGQVFADLQDAAREMTWSLHYEQLLWDIQAILNTTAARPGCMPAEVAAGVLTGVLEFLGHHGCWCSISWLLAEAIRSQLLQHAKPVAKHRLQEAQPLAWQSSTEATGAMCAGFVTDLAASPSHEQPASGSSASPAAVSSSRRVLSALSAAVARGQKVHQLQQQQALCTSADDADSSSSYQTAGFDAAGVHPVAASSSTARPSQLPADACCSSAACSCASSSKSSSKSSNSSVGSDSTCSAPMQEAQLQGPSVRAAPWRNSSCHAWNLVLVVTAASLVLLMLLLNFTQPVPCQSVAGQQVSEQLKGCALTYQPMLQVSGRFDASFGHVAVGLLMYAPFLALLVLTVSVASKLCLVL